MATIDQTRAAIVDPAGAGIATRCENFIGGALEGLDGIHFFTRS